MRTLSSPAEASQRHGSAADPRHELKGHIVRDGVTLETGGKAFLERGISLNNERISVDPDEKSAQSLPFAVRTRAAIASPGARRRRSLLS